MIPNTKLREVTSSGVAASGEFGISLNDSAHIMTILRDTLYSDKVLAVLREYSSNAWDAHKVVGKGDVPIEVTLPETLDPTLSIRDFGPGLSQEDVFTIYTQYGASTKRGDDNSVGMLGIGCKSAFAYSDSFTITSWHASEKKTYVAVLDPSERGIINLLNTEPCKTEETGVLIQIAVKPEDYVEFEIKAQQLFRFYNPLPKINTKIPELPPNQSKFKNGILFGEPGTNNFYHREGWTAVMGCVPYRIDLSQLSGIASYLRNLSGLVYFDIGEVQINASREGLKYNDNTKAKLVEKVNALIDEFVSSTLKRLEDKNLSYWEKRLELQLFRNIGLPMPTESIDLVAAEVKLDKVLPESIVIRDHNGAEVRRIYVASSSKLVIRDEPKRLSGYTTDYKDYIVEFKKGVHFPYNILLSELRLLCETCKITGIPIRKLSECPWSAPKAKCNSGLAVGTNYQKTVFQLKVNDQSHRYYPPYSRYWVPVKRTPTSDDVFVILAGFKEQSGSFYSSIVEDRKIADALGVKFPAIYGYKNTTKVPLTVESCVGTLYEKWSAEFHIKQRKNPLVTKLMEDYAWRDSVGSYYTPHYLTEGLATEEFRKVLREGLGIDHPITILFQKHREAVGRIEEANKDLKSVIDILSRNYEIEGTEAQKVTNALYEAYPMLSRSCWAISVMWGGENKSAWHRYVLDMDELNELRKKATP